ncbi:hypothetical protein B0H10DRAFT_1950707 [Mycena sp. CBHHK59/15]|nr:hypothetical protein B0H10DRAFT_1950707 [Mycena sp. CBHHK59/15]
MPSTRSAAHHSAATHHTAAPHPSVNSSVHPSPLTAFVRTNRPTLIKSRQVPLAASKLQSTNSWVIVLPQLIQIVNASNKYLTTWSNDPNEGRFGWDNEFNGPRRVFTAILLENNLENSLYEFRTPNGKVFGHTADGIIAMSVGPIFLIYVVILTFKEKPPDVGVKWKIIPVETADTFYLKTFNDPIGDRFMGPTGDRTIDTAEEAIPAIAMKFGEPIISKEITDVQYDVASATITELTPYVALNQVVENTSDAMQSPKVSFEKIVSMVGTWNNTEGYKVGVKSTFSCGVPEVAGGSIEVSYSSTETHELGGSTMTQTTITVEESFNVPPRTRARATATASQAKIEVPFTYTVKVVHRDLGSPCALQDGTSKVSEETGIYRSLDTYDFKFVYGKFEPIDFRVLL